MESINNTNGGGEPRARELVERLLALKAKVAEVEGKELSDGEFVRRFLSFSSSAWSRLVAGTYPGGRWDAMIAKMEASVAAVEEMLPGLAERATYTRSFVRTGLARAAFAAINKARTDGGDRRVVVVLAPTGYGKSALAEYFRGKGAICCEGRNAWRASYKSFCADVAAAAGRKVPASASEARVESEMLSVLGNRAGLLFVDEANTMSGACANAIKYVVNRTAYTVVIAAIPNMWDRFLAGARDEVLQLVNRCQPVIRATRIAARDVEAFLTRQGLPAAFAPDLAAAANQFGGFRTVLAVCDALASLGGSPAREDLDAELRRCRDNLAASGVGK